MHRLSWRLLGYVNGDLVPVGSVAHQDNPKAETALVALGLSHGSDPLAMQWPSTKSKSYRDLRLDRESIVKSITEYAELVELFNRINPKGVVEEAEKMTLPGK